jgi:hypothetical protein
MIDLRLAARRLLATPLFTAIGIAVTTGCGGRTRAGLARGASGLSYREW